MSWYDGEIPFCCAPCFIYQKGAYSLAEPAVCTRCCYQTRLFPLAEGEDANDIRRIPRFFKSAPPRWKHCEETLLFKRHFAKLADDLLLRSYDFASELMDHDGGSTFLPQGTWE